MEFKIIAIQPLETCDIKYSKILTRGETYYLYNTFKVKADSISRTDHEAAIDLYSSSKGPIVSISAIVGKNGSGKSTLIELLYAAIYLTANHLGLLTDLEDSGKYKPKGLSVAVYYQKASNYYSLIIRDTQIELKRQIGITGKFKRLTTWKNKEVKNIKDLFYSVVVNYSHYGLNAQGDNLWLNEVFHKNDGYQLPIVINPFRNRGTIDINVENSLVIPRIVTNLLTLRRHKKTLFSELSPGRFADQIRFSLNNSKIILNTSDTALKSAFKKYRAEMIDIVTQEFDINTPVASSDKEEKYIDASFSYLLKKLYFINLRYRPYQGISFNFLSKKNISNKDNSAKQKTLEEYDFNGSKLTRLIKKLRDNPSHISLKIEQTINFLENLKFYTKRISKLLPIEQLANEIQSIRKRRPLIYLVPPPFFKVDIKFKDKGYLEALSSGEKQRINSSASWTYHLLNLISVKEDKIAKYHRFNCINLIFDEIELYYHPEMQRTFIEDFLEYLRRIEFPKGIAINCIFITHSPFILSDIPNTNILFLTEDGTPNELASSTRTFGANIHELLKHNFFLTHGAMGSFAQSKINDIIKFLNGKESEYSWNESSADKFINMISEPIIRKSLRTLFNQVFISTKTEIERQIAYLQKELKNFNT